MRNSLQANRSGEDKTAAVLVKLKELEELEERRNYMVKLTDDPIYKKQLHVARTLGQSYYDDSADKQTRDNDNGDDKQLVTRYMERMQRELEGKDLKEMKESKEEKYLKDSKEGETEGYTELPILVVKQLWLWTIDKSIYPILLRRNANPGRNNHHGFPSEIQQA